MWVTLSLAVMGIWPLNSQSQYPELGLRLELGLGENFDMSDPGIELGLGLALCLLLVLLGWRLNHRGHLGSNSGSSALRFGFRECLIRLRLQLALPYCHFLQVLGERVH